MRILLSVIQNKLFLNMRRMNPPLKAAFEFLFFAHQIQWCANWGAQYYWWAGRKY